MKIYIIIFMLALPFAYGQEMPKVHFNHIYCILDPVDFKAICKSEFVNDSLCARFTKPDSTGTYFFGPSSFLELLKSRNEIRWGFSGIAFSVDKIGELKVLQNFLSKTSDSEISTQKRKIDVQEFPPFYMLSVVSDSMFHAKSRIYVWFMEYKLEYFQHNNYRINDSLLTRENYLEKYYAQGANKILKRFTGVVIKLDSSEKEYLTGIFKSIGYSKINENHFVTPDNFQFFIKDRLPGDQKAIESLEFESSRNFSKETTYKISENLIIVLDGGNGRLVFK